MKTQLKICGLASVFVIGSALQCPQNANASVAIRSVSPDQYDYYTASPTPAIQSENSVSHDSQVTFLLETSQMLSQTPHSETAPTSSETPPASAFSEYKSEYELVTLKPMRPKNPKPESPTPPAASFNFRPSANEKALIPDSGENEKKKATDKNSSQTF